MEKSEFTKRLRGQFNLILNWIQPDTEREIIGRQSRSDATTFREWLKSEHEKALADASFLDGMGDGYKSPEGAAQNIANLIGFPGDEIVDWDEHYSKAVRLLTVTPYDLASDWKCKSWVLRYIKAAKADLRAKVFARHIEAERKTGLQLFPAFAALFFDDEKAHRALKAAMSAGIIDETGKKKLGVRKIVPAIVQFWEAVSDPKFELTHTWAEGDAPGETYLQQCHAIAEQFGTTISDSAIYDRAGKRAGKYFTAVSRALGGT